MLYKTRSIIKNIFRELIKLSQKSKKMWQLAALLAVNLTLLILISSVSAKAVRLGGSGERVAEIQRELHKLNLFTEKPSGIFDFKTKSSAAEFQRISGLDANGEADYKTVSALGLNAASSECFSARTELLARCIIFSGCRTYPEMLTKAEEIIAETSGAVTLGKYIAENYPDFLFLSDEPSPEAYSAAIDAIRKAARF